MSGSRSKKLRKIVRKITNEKIAEKVNSDFTRAMETVQTANKTLIRKNRRLAILFVAANLALAVVFVLNLLGVS